MKRTFVLSIVLGVLLCLSTISTQADVYPRRDGNWWRTLQGAIKKPYALGFFDGMNLGASMSISKFSDAKTKNQCMADAKNSYDYYFMKYFKDCTNTQIVDGLDDFYSDYKNRRILLEDAIWLVVSGIAGTPKEELEKMIENFRKRVSD